MKAKLATTILFISVLVVAPSQGLSDWPNPKGSMQRDLSSTAVHPPFEIDWEEAISKGGCTAVELKSLCMLY
ncbi:MAG TPA: hypothetical protein PLR77_06720, partial [Caldisericia bacterium]|nr:hypothetical protein [Caldisericia bacterium]